MATEITQTLSEIQKLATEYRKEVQRVMLATDEADGLEDGISLLTAKSATLMHYNAALIKFTQARLKGTSVKGIIDELIEDWVVLSKMAPLEKKLRYQIDRLLKKTPAKPERGDEADMHRPDPDAVVVDEDEQNSSSDEERAYRPPRFSEVFYDGDGDKRLARAHKEKERYQARAIRSSEVQEMLAAVQGRPEEVYADEDLRTPEAQRLLREQKQRERFEEDNFVRLSLSKKEKRRSDRVGEDARQGSQPGGDTFSGLVALADRVVHKDKTSKLHRVTTADDDEREELEREEQLDQIFEDELKKRRPSPKAGGSARKRRRT
ncbi:hypothetical protein BWQ96_04901 [Gracilariopsis chorda]|uniref:Neuroguidin n=1 Tax=Gracilariopsis chorda TaxID=448386 RepID=A0A2V3ITD3_9FLOR|nr:hypothetical protein BWQ96_04901 [Gracilariopsis chorda]|eukprot:PXF45381.1 hypothetical protein BWQ96_04901 [Gracilariopsis chorda]